MMTTLEEIKKRLRDQKPHLAARYSVKEIGIFGSYVLWKTTASERPGYSDRFRGVS